MSSTIQQDEETPGTGTRYVIVSYRINRREEGRKDLAKKSFKNAGAFHRETTGPEGFEPPLSGSEGRRLDPD